MVVAFAPRRFSAFRTGKGVVARWVTKMQTRSSVTMTATLTAGAGRAANPVRAALARSVSDANAARRFDPRRQVRHPRADLSVSRPDVLGSFCWLR